MISRLKLNLSKLKLSYLQLSRLSWSPPIIDLISILVVLTPITIQIILFLVDEYQTLNRFLFVIDDVWIHLEFARNLINGNGFSFNPGEPIAASTAPLYTLLVAVTNLVIPNPFLTVFVLGILLSLLTVLLVYQTALVITQNRLFSVLIGVLVSVNPWLTWSGLSGMEIPLGSFLLMLGVWSYFRHRQEESGWPTYLPILCFSLLTLVRPESYAIIGAYLFVHFLSTIIKLHSQSHPQLLRNWLMTSLIFLAVISPYGIFSLLTTGSFFPNTYQAKVGDLGFIGYLKGNHSPVETIVFGITLISNYYLDFKRAVLEIAPLAAWLTPPALALFLSQSWRKRDPHYLFVPTVLILFVVMVGIMVPSDRVSWPWNRHMLYLTPLIISFGWWGVHWLYRSFPRALRIPFVLILLGLALFGLRGQSLTVRKYYIDRTTIINQEHIAAAQWLQKNVPEKAQIATSDIGIIGYYTPNYIIDTEGLINPNIREFKYRRNSSQKDAEVFKYLATKKPDFLVKFSWVYPSFSTYDFPPIQTFGSLVIYQTPWTRDEFKLD